MGKVTNHKLLVTSQEAACMLSMSERTLWGLSHQGEISQVRIGKRGVRYSVAELKRWVDSRRDDNSIDSISQS